MRVYRFGHLTIMSSGIEEGILIDWRMREPGKRWRIKLGREPLWVPLFSVPSRRGRFWAFWAVGNDT